MKKTALLLILLTIIFSSQNTFSQGVRIGMNFSKQNLEFDGEKMDEIKNLPGINLGFLKEFELKNGFSIESGLILNTKGYKVKESSEGIDTKEYHYLVYADVPVHGKYTFETGGPNIYIEAGPYFGIGIFGKGAIIQDDGTQKETFEIDYTWDSDEPDSHKRLDIGFDIGAGFEFGSFVMGAKYGIGLKNISTIDMLSVKNRVLSVSIGTTFGK